jgi:hypothetical protein
VRALLAFRPGRPHDPFDHVRPCSTTFDQPLRHVHAGQDVLQDARQRQALQGRPEHREAEHGDGLVAAGQPGRPAETHALLQAGADRLGAEARSPGRRRPPGAVPTGPGTTSPCAHLREYVASRGRKEPPDPNTGVVAGDLPGKVRGPKAQDSGLGIHLCGGPQHAGEPIDETGELDELVVKSYPLVHGPGLPTSGSGFAAAPFAPESARTSGNGAPVRTYAGKR